MDFIYVFRELHWERSDGADELVKYVASTNLDILFKIRDQEENRVVQAISKQGGGRSIITSNSGHSIGGGAWAIGRTFTVLDTGEKYYFEVAKVEAAK